MTKWTFLMIFGFCFLTLTACQGRSIEGENVAEPAVATSDLSIAAVETATAVATQPPTVIPSTDAPTETAVPTDTPTVVPTETAVPTETPIPYNFDVQFASIDHGLALTIGEQNSWEETYVYAPEVVYHDGLFHMFYTGGGGGVGLSFAAAVGYATSTDGITFEKYAQNPILKAPANSGADVHVPVVTVTDDGTWVMYLDEKKGSLFQSNTVRVATAPAPEGPWTLEETAVYQAGSNSWNQRLIPQTLLQTDAGYLLLFEARTQGRARPAIGALTSENGRDFVIYDDPLTNENDLAGADPILVRSGESGSWNRDGVGSPMLFQQDDGYGLFYLGDGPSKSIEGSGVSLKIGYAFSTDGFHWQEHPDNPLIEILGESGRPYLGSIQVDDNQLFIYYAINDGSGGIGAMTVERIE